MVALHTANFSLWQDRHCACNVKQRRFRFTIAVVEK